MKKVVLIGLGVFAVLAIGIGIFLADPGRFIKQALESEGPKFTETAVTVDAVDLDLLEGKAAIHDLLIGAPQGFKADHTFSLGEVAVGLNIDQTTEQRIVIDRILIDAPSIIYEIGPGGKTNVSAIQQAVARNAGGGAGGGESGSSPGEGGEGPRFEIGEVLIKGAQVSLAASALQGEGATVALPEIRITNIGKDDDGASAGEVADAIFTALNSTITTSVTSGALKDLLAGSLGGKADALKGAAKSLEGLQGDDPAKAADDAARAIRDLF